ncbi:FAD-dependent pyridine nucleotide-disulphide oxidoreductase [uncultured spirochete]|jgi:nitrite reductase (NADH) large subunit|uniref:FAD-dependent pyridine nucleotide-disulphide oxidoreductase n=1 Tax=uncultured spirochete TaxID=156406 RepID=A0A3P3XH53_9SPIR|nr:FAD-dependent oxidoreductase [Rectinema subterraneum]SLM11582.1 FAD-dependent pyridine nucleotide-disulphide oxidoreductase [uncultured spirochete]
MKIVIIGNGIAATSAATKIREFDASCEITMLSDENTPFYSRPRLLDYLAGKVSFEQITIKSEQWYNKLNIELVSGAKVFSITPQENKIITSKGDISYDALLVASGASAATPPFFRPDLKNVFRLRTKEDADRIIAAAQHVRTAAIIGGGLLGIETGFALTSRGLTTTVIEIADRLLPKQLDAESSLLLKASLEEKGLRFLTGKQAAALDADREGLCITCTDATVLRADIIVVSAGIRPNVGFLEGSGVNVGRGIIVDEKLRTNIGNIYAAGDCAEFRSTLYGIWPAAKEQGEIAGAIIAGQDAVYNGSIMSAKLKVVGIEVASIGDIAVGLGTRTESQREGSSFRKLFYENGRLKGAILIGDTSDYFKLQKEIALPAPRQSA